MGISLAAVFGFGRTTRDRRVASTLVVALLAVAGCSGSSGSPKAAGTKHSALPEATEAQARAALAADIVSGLPASARASLAAIKQKLGKAATTLPPVNFRGRRAAKTSYVPAPGPTGSARLLSARLAQARPSVAGGDLAVALLLGDILFTGSNAPSKSGAEALVRFMHQTVSLVGLDASPDTDHGDQSTESPYTITSDKASLSGTLKTSISVDVDHSFLKVDLVRSIGGTDSTTNQSWTASVHNVTSLNYCPDAGGTVPVSIDSTFAVDGTSAVRANIAGQFVGHVNDAAFLSSVDGNATFTGSNGGTGDNYSGQMGGLSFGVANGAVGAADAGSVGGNANGVDLADQAAIARLDLHQALNLTLAEAQHFWRSNVCVTAAIPDFGQYAYGPPLGLGHDRPDSVDFVKTVEPLSKTEFTVKVHQRYEHKDVPLTLSENLTKGVKSLEPASLAPTPGKATYTAGDQERDVAEAKFQSTSRRGIATLNGRFITEEPPPLMSLTGTIVSGFGVGSATAKVTVTKTQFTAKGAGDNGEAIYEADLPVTDTITYSFTGGLAIPCAASGVESGKVYLTARAELRGDTRFWVFKADPGRSHFTTTVQCQISAFNNFTGGGGLGAKFFAALGDIIVPTKPATTNVARSRAIPVGTDASRAAVTIYPIPKKP